MPDVKIDKLKLEVPGGAAKKPEDLAERVARQLVNSALPAVSQQLDILQIAIEAVPGENDDDLARRIAIQIVRHLDGTV